MNIFNSLEATKIEQNILFATFFLLALKSLFIGRCIYETYIIYHNTYSIVSLAELKYEVPFEMSKTIF